MTCTEVDAQMSACKTYFSLTETTYTACGCSTAPPSNSVLSSPIIEYNTEWCVGGEGGCGKSRKGCQMAYDMCLSLVELSSN